MKRTYVRVTVRMDSPWRIGSWETRSADAVETLIDGMTEAPMLPGSSVVGGLRRSAGDAATALFGPEAAADLEVSPWWVLGTVVEDAERTTRRRVSIDRQRGSAALRGMFAVDEVRGGRVRIYFRSEVDDPQPFIDLVRGWCPRIGAGRTVGMGRATVVEVCHRTLDLSSQDDVRELLHPGSPVERVDRLLAAGETVEVKSDERRPLLSARVRCDVLAQPDETQDRTFGSAWKGVLRSRVEFIGRSVGLPVCRESDEWTGCGECSVCHAFGSTTSGGVWEFLDSPWDQHERDKRVRIGIDRFTGGAREGAWFEQQFERDVTMGLRIMGSRLEGQHAWVERALLHALRDLNDGLISIGPEGAAGFGHVRFESIEMGEHVISLDELDPVVTEVA